MLEGPGAHPSLQTVPSQLYSFRSQKVFSIFLVLVSTVGCLVSTVGRLRLAVSGLGTRGAGSVDHLRNRRGDSLDGLRGVVVAGGIRLSAIIAGHRAGELVKDDSKKSSDEGSGKEEPKVAFVSGSGVERSGSNHKSNGERGVEEALSDVDGSASNDSDKIGQSVEEATEDPGAGSENDDDQHCREDQLKDECLRGGEVNTEVQNLVAETVNGEESSEDVTQKLGEDSDEQVSPAKSRVAKGNGDGDYGVQVRFLCGDKNRRCEAGGHGKVEISHSVNHARNDGEEEARKSLLQELSHHR